MHPPLLHYWEAASHLADRGGWWVRALSEELTSMCVKCRQIWPAHQLAKEGCTDCKANPHWRKIWPKKKGLDLGSRRHGVNVHSDAIGPSGRNQNNIPSDSHLGLYLYTAAV